MNIIPEKLGLTPSVSPEEPLPIKYTEKITDPNLMLGRIVGLMAHISKRTVQPISYDDEVLKQENSQSILDQAYNCISSTITKDEERVLEAMLNEYKWLEENYPFEFTKQPLRTMSFSVGWKILADDIFDQGGNMYDLLVFTDHEFLKSSVDSTLVYGYMGKIPELSEYQLRIFKEEDGREGLKYAKRGTIVFKAIYDEVNVSGFFKRGWFLRKGEKWGAVNERGEWILPLEYETIKICNNGGHFLKKDGKWAYCNEKGEMVTEFIYDDFDTLYRSSHEDFLIVQSNSKRGLINKKGKEILPIEYEDISASEKGLFIIKKDGIEQYYDLYTASSFGPKFQESHDFHYSHPNEAAVKINDKWGVIDRKGNFILPIEYDKIDIEAPHIYYVTKDGKMGKINQNKEIIFPFKYKSISSFNKEGIAVVENDEGLYGYIDKDDNLLIDFRFRRADNFEGNYAIVYDSKWPPNKQGVIDKTGTIIVPLQYDDIHITNYGIIDVRNFDRARQRYVKGMYDIETGNSIPCIYEDIDILRKDYYGRLICMCKEFGKDQEIEIRLDPIDKIGQVHEVIRTLCIQYRENKSKNKKGEESVNVSIVNIFDKKDISSHMTTSEILEVDVKSGKSSVLIIPEQINGNPVTVIEQGCCKNLDIQIKWLLFPTTLEQIGNEAFTGQLSLETIIIQEGIRSIGNGAFEDCKNLKNIVIGKRRGRLLTCLSPLDIEQCQKLAISLPDLTFYIPQQSINKGYDKDVFHNVLPQEDYEALLLNQFMFLSREYVSPYINSHIAIVKDFAVILETNRVKLDLLGKNPSFCQLCPEGTSIKKVIAGFDTYIALTEDGKLLVGPDKNGSGTNHLIERWKDKKDLADIVDIAGSESLIILLHSDGTLSCIERDSSQVLSDEVKSWSGIKQVACGNNYIIALKEDGSFNSCGKYYTGLNNSSTKPITVSFDTFQFGYYERYLARLCSNGRIESAFISKARDWRYVVKVSVGANGDAVGLKIDGTAYATSKDPKMVKTVESWRNIKDIECKYGSVVALLNTGEIVRYQCGFRVSLY